MSNQSLPAAMTITSDFSIDELGFTAMNGTPVVSGAASGIIGAPRIRPTEAGLSIEDYFADTLDSIILSVIEEFQRREDDAIVTGSPVIPSIFDERRAHSLGEGIDPNFDVDLDGLLRTWRGIPAESDLLAELTLLAAH